MKHVFYIHSPITYLVAVSVCQYLKLSAEDVLFICDGFYRSDKDITAIDISRYNSGGAVDRILKTIKHFNKATYIDQVIDGFIGQHNFTAYVPVMRQVEKIMVTHEKCAGFHFIEEGLADYYYGETLSSFSITNAKSSWRLSLRKSHQRKEIFRQIIALLRGYNQKLQTLPFSYSCYTHFNQVKFFGIDTHAFPMADAGKRVIIPLVCSRDNTDAALKPDNKVVWIGDNGVDFYGYGKELYLQGIREGLIAYLKRRGQKELLVKFHRGESKEMREAQLNLFRENGIEVRLIADNVIMEELLLTAENVKVCGVYSSLLYYAAIMGHTALSIYELLKKDYFKSLEGKNMSFFWSKVKDISAES
ncbi:hypothetical protein ECE50_023285 [Chitinophaga sp. Mgbs1]|uniref:Uncharacterized protein n=1 Tax=Chitinophaga solisilvae TaxID=1233460 RepID=A0A433WE07_9BACT|nr:hypothetical protein [Chitinophaga solisilvae]